MCGNHFGLPFGYSGVLSDGKYPYRVGNVDVKKVFEDSDFEICGEQRNIRQYYSFGKGLEYNGDRKAPMTSNNRKV